jgi:hypothetical protein
MNQAENPDPWNIYWHADNVDSCVASASKRDAEAIGQLWQDFAADQSSAASVLDLATGNGTVPLALLQGNESLQITGVDKADIDPLKFLSSPGLLAKVEFVGGIDICSMPFEADSFDALTSQFGIEYAPLEAAISSAAAVLKTAGNLKFLMHHSDSEIVTPARLKIREMASLLHYGGLIHCLDAFLKGEQRIDELEAAGKQHLDSGAGRSSKISGQIFEGVERVIQSLQQGDRGAAEELALVMATRLRADHDRLTQLTDAALTEQQMQQLSDQLEEANVVVGQLKPLIIHESSEDQALIGWQISGQKR